MNPASAILVWTYLARPYYCYLLSKSYIGYTNNVFRRVRQHRGEIKGGARATRKHRDKDLFIAAYVGPFFSKTRAKHFEHVWKQSAYGVKQRLYALFHLLQSGTDCKGFEMPCRRKSRKSKTIGSKTAGLNTAGAKTAGAKTAGLNTAGLNTAGAKTNPQRRFAAWSKTWNEYIHRHNHVYDQPFGIYVHPSWKLSDELHIVFPPRVHIIKMNE
jgi:predicted GIY-YIG superfamily endonuclease